MDTSKFLNQKYTARTEDVPVPELAVFFGDDKAVWTIRGLTAAELAKTKDAYDRTETARAIIDAMAADGSEKAEGIKKMLGLMDSDVPQDVTRRIESLTIGTVTEDNYDQTREVAVKLSEVYPVTFYNLTNKIDALTGQGYEPGKSKASGKKTASAPA